MTVFESPGSNRTAVPAAMSSRLKKAFSRSNARNRFASQKWKCEPTWARANGEEIELQSAGESREGTYLDGSVTGVGDLEPDALPPFVDPDDLASEDPRPRHLFVADPLWFV